MSWSTKANNGTKHSPTCGRVFNRYDSTCPRCLELSGGAKARAGWGDSRKQADARRSEQITAFFAPGGPYSRMTDIQKHCCTAFEW